MFGIRVLFSVAFLYFLSPATSQVPDLNDTDIDKTLADTELMKTYINCMVYYDELCPVEARLMLNEFDVVLAGSGHLLREKTQERFKKTWQTIKSDPRFAGDFDKVVKTIDPKERYSPNLNKFIA